MSVEINMILDPLPARRQPRKGKPHLSISVYGRIFGLSTSRWQCHGGSMTDYGSTPEDAYFWWNLRREAVLKMLRFRVFK